MHILSIIFFCVASSSDNFVIGLSYGGKSIKIKFLNNLLVAFISCIGTFLAMLFGKGLYNIISAKNANVIGSILLIVFGLYMLYSSVKNRREEIIETAHSYNDYIEHPEIIDADNSKEIDLKEAAILGVILCINNIGLGIGASITGMNIYITSFMSLVFSVVFVKLGLYIGRKMIYGRLAAYSEFVSACLILLLGVYELFV